MDIWRVATADEKTYIITAAKERLLAKCILIIFLAVFILGSAAIIINLEHDIEFDSLMEDYLGYYPRSLESYAESELNTAKAKAKAEIGNRYTNRALFFALIVILPAVSWIIKLYNDYRKGLDKNYVLTNAVCIEKECTRNSYGHYYGVSIRVGDGTEIENIRIERDLYDEINHAVPLIATAPIDTNKELGIDIKKVNIFLESDIKNINATDCQKDTEEN